MPVFPPPAEPTTVIMAKFPDFDWINQVSRNFFETFEDFRGFFAQEETERCQ